mgnify:CR=1 FL=1
MDQRLYFVVEIDGLSFVFENISYAASFMVDAVEHVTACRYYPGNVDVSMHPVSYDKLCEMFPRQYKKEDNADETTACTVPGQTES